MSCFVQSHQTKDPPPSPPPLSLYNLCVSRCTPHTHTDHTREHAREHTLTLTLGFIRFRFCVCVLLCVVESQPRALAPPPPSLHSCAWFYLGFGLVWFGSVWLGLVWFGSAWFGLVWFGSVWLGLVWFGSAWFGLVWFGSLCIFRNQCLSLCSGIPTSSTRTCPPTPPSPPLHTPKHTYTLCALLCLVLILCACLGTSLFLWYGMPTSSTRAWGAIGPAMTRSPTPSPPKVCGAWQLLQRD